MYSQFVVERVTSEEADQFPADTDFIDGGGFFAVAVLTIGIPFN
ncbi:MAG: hypothetical protein O6940_09485 [Ignavibacteria bacterium]|nr:hypothetical protein [Ignavibacteria bacterium]